MGMDLLADGSGVFFQDFLDASGGQSLTVFANEEGIVFLVAQQGRTALFDIFRQCSGGRHSDQYHPLLGPLPPYAYLFRRQVDLFHEWFRLHVQLKLDRPATLWRMPIETVSNSEGGFERVYQCSCVFPHWRIRLAPGESWQVNLTLSLLEPEP